jgi:hypothetical protein
VGLGRAGNHGGAGDARGQDGSEEIKKVHIGRTVALGLGSESLPVRSPSIYAFELAGIYNLELAYICNAMVLNELYPAGSESSVREQKRFDKVRSCHWLLEKETVATTCLV